MSLFQVSCIQGVNLAIGQRYPWYRAGSGRVQAEAVAPAAGLFQATSVTK
jgi:hypothetical protein